MNLPCRPYRIVHCSSRVSCFFFLSLFLGIISGIGANGQACRAADPPSVQPVPPQMPPATSATSATPQIDPAAMALLKKVQTAMLAPKTYRAECWTTTTYDKSPTGQARHSEYEMSFLTAKKPNLMRYDTWDMSVDAQGKWSRQTKTPACTYVCDGKTHWMQFGVFYRVDKDTEAGYLSTNQEPWGGFFAADASPYAMTEYTRTHEKLLEVRRDGVKAVDGIPCDKIVTHHIALYQGEAIDYRTSLYIGRDGLVRRQVEHIQIGDRPSYTRDAVLHHVQTNVTIEHPKTVFAYIPPKGVRPESKKASSPKEAPRPRLLANGTVAPEITAIGKDGATVKLSDMKGKVVVVDFWASWCPPCIAAMPHNQAVIKKLQAANVPVVFLAVDNSEEKTAFDGWVKAHPKLDALRFVYADPQTADVGGTVYRVSGIPTQYVIDAQGVIRASFVGYDGPTDDLEKAIRATLLPQPAK